MPTCVFCNASVATGSRYCPRCGAAVRLDDEAPSEPTGTAQPDSDDLLALTRAGRKIEAIKKYREQTGAGLKEAKDAIELLAATGRLPQAEVAAAPATADEFESRLLELLRAGEKIEAIKQYRQQTGVGLKDAKEAVESLAARHAIVSKSAGCAGMILVIVLPVFLAISSAAWLVQQC
jgi:ribosomal protein L7/L12